MTTKTLCRSLALLALYWLPAMSGAVDDHPVVFLWPAGAPGFESRKDEPEKASGTIVTNIQNPSLTVYLPSRERATGAAVIVTPGGGHSHLAIQHEGYVVAQWLAEHGIAAFVLKYRLSKDGAVAEGTSPYTVDEHELGDAQRALRLVRSRADEWALASNRIGIVGFSAGGEISLLAATRSAEHGNPESNDNIERQSARPDFVGLIYPGGLLRTDITLTKDAPPFFLACGADDRVGISEALPEFYLKCKRLGIQAELHVFSKTRHGFGLKPGDTSASSRWPELFRTWLAEQTFLLAPGHAR